MSCYQERLYAHIRRMVNGHEDTDDILQNTFIKAFKGLSGFQEKSSLYTWLYRIATNETLTHLTSQKKRRTEDLSSHLDIKEVEVVLDSEDILAKLQSATDSLPERQKLVFNMRYYDELSYQEMSNLLQTSEGSLKASYHHALKKIEAILTK